MAKSLVPEPTLTSYPDAQENEGEEEEMTEKNKISIYKKGKTRKKKKQLSVTSQSRLNSARV